MVSTFSLKCVLKCSDLSEYDFPTNAKQCAQTLSNVHKTHTAIYIAHASFPPPIFTVFISFFSLPYNSLRLSTFCMIPSFFLRCFLLRCSPLFLHFHFLLSSCLLILPTTHVLCFIPFLYSGTKHTEFIYRRTTSIYKLPNGYKHSVFLLTR